MSACEQAFDRSDTMFRSHNESQPKTKQTAVPRCLLCLAACCASLLAVPSLSHACQCTSYETYANTRISVDTQTYDWLMQCSRSDLHQGTVRWNRASARSLVRKCTNGPHLRQLLNCIRWQAAQHTTFASRQQDDHIIAAQDRHQTTHVAVAASIAMLPPAPTYLTRSDATRVQQGFSKPQ